MEMQLEAWGQLPNLGRGAGVVLGACGTYLFGGWDAILQALVILVLIDYLTGVMAAYFEKTLNSEVGFKGIVKKICIFLMVAMAQTLDVTAGLGEPWIRTCVIMFFVANESLSALENMGRLGVPLPEPLLAALQKLHKPHTSAQEAKR
jgi:toxin secretion/phage lysis holin